MNEMESIIVRINLMSQVEYLPYCGANFCSYHWPRVKWDNEKNQFTCACGWVSQFPDDFIQRYKSKWGITPTNK
jgi:hypothetical protein